MNTAQRFRLDVDTLNQISFERSKVWADIIKKCESYDETEIIEFDDFEDYFAGEEKKEKVGRNTDEQAAEVYVSEDDEAAQTVLHNTMVGMPTVFVTEDAKNGGPNKNASFMAFVNSGDFQQVLNETMSVVAEHKRKCKENGIDRILDTFDSKTIDREVGGWLQRNQSSSSVENFQMGSDMRHYNSNKLSRKEPHYMPRIDSVSDTDSLESVDTARYIISSRRRGASLSRGFSTACTKTIKSYRTMQSKRDALREKYTFDDHNDELHLQELRYRRAHKKHLKRFLPQTTIDGFDLQRGVDRKFGARQTYRHKRRVVADMDSSSDSSANYDIDKHDRSLRRKRHWSQRPAYRFPSDPRQLRYRSLHYARQLHSLHNSMSTSSSFLSTHSSEHSAKKYMKYNSRPLKHRSEYHCKHLADSSMEAWVIQNVDSRKKQSLQLQERRMLNDSEITQTTGLNIAPLKREKKAKAEVVTTLTQDTQKEDSELKVKSSTADLQANMTRRKKPTRASEKKCSSKNEPNVETKLPKCRQAKQKSTKKPRPVKKNPDAKLKAKEEAVEAKKVALGNESLKTDSSFEVNLQKAIQFSRQTYEIEIEKFVGPQQSMNNGCDITEAAGVSKVTTELEQSSKNGEQSSQPQETYDGETLSDDNDLIKMQLKPQPKFAKLRKLAKLNLNSRKDVSTDETFFINASKMCNSTALPNHTVNARQIVRAPRTSTVITPAPTAKRSAISSTNPTHSNFSTPSPDNSATTQADPLPQDVGNEHDCTMVSSSTEPQRNKSVLVYTPARKSSVPASTLVDGYFSVTEDHMSSVIGAKNAQKFIKYYMGRRKFNATSTVYYEPPAAGLFDTSDDSELDGMDKINQCGGLYEVSDKMM